MLSKQTINLIKTERNYFIHVALIWSVAGAGPTGFLVFITGTTTRIYQQYAHLTSHNFTSHSKALNILNEILQKTNGFVASETVTTLKIRLLQVSKRDVALRLVMHYLPSTIAILILKASCKATSISS